MEKTKIDEKLKTVECYKPSQLIDTGIRTALSTIVGENADLRLGNCAQMFLPLIGSWTLIRAFEGINDGLVSVRSQMWESELIASDGTQKQIIQREFPFRADHLNQTGWWNLSETLDGQISGNPLEEKLDYELQVRNIYLEIARNLPNQ